MPTCKTKRSFEKSSTKKVFKNAKKVIAFLRGSDNFLGMQDDFTTQVQSDEFASEWEAMQNAADFVAEFNAYLDEMEKKYWQEIGNRGN